MHNYIVVKDQFRKNRRFGLDGRTIEFKMKPIPPDVEPVGWVKNVIKEIFENATKGLDPQDQVGFSFCSKDFSRGEGWIRFKPLSDVTFDDVWNMIAGIYQSNSTGLNTESFCLRITSVRVPIGRGRIKKCNTFTEDCAKRKGIITIKNKDNLCLPRALVVAIAHANKDPQFEAVRVDIRKEQMIRAQSLLKDANVIVPKEGCGILELELFQNYLTSYKIVVYKYGNKGRDLIFEGDNDSSVKLNLLFHDNHFNVITSLTSAFCCIYYCENCHIPYNNKNMHRCGGTCSACMQTPACQYSMKIFCDICKRCFKGSTCFDNHVTHSICDKFKLCPNCFKTVDKKHHCGKIFCKICKKHQSQGHLCYMQVDSRQPKTNETLFIFYDLETRQESVQSDGSLLHEPNLCVFRQCCDVCIDTDKVVCEKCGLRLQKVKCDDPITPFMHHIFTIRMKFKRVVIIGHNAGGFDHHFLLNYIINNTDLTPELLTRGTRLILMQVENVKFLDSLNYFPMPLSALPKSFGLNELKKGFFPHLFNTINNQNYVGPLPPIEYYDPDNMKGTDDGKDDARKMFLNWYEDHKNDFFDFQKEIVEYCTSDVEILTQACLKFRKMMMAEGNVCPFTEATTLPSACNKIYRRNFLKPETIGIIPKGGYRWKDVQSRVAIQWLVLEEKQRNIKIISSARGREHVISGMKVDGYCLETNQVFEFHGCYYHGCPRCFRYERDSPLREDKHTNMNLRYHQTVSKIEKLKSLGYDVIEKWECQFKIDLPKELHNFVDTHPLVGHMPLNPRDAFFGGRTGNTREYYKIQNNEKIKYVDVCSLYPWVNKYGKYPIGHPEVFVGEDCYKLDLKKTDGLIKCKILPPQNLYHPVLPTKMNDKLMFVLCRTCGEEMSKDSCYHADDDRALEGTWVIDEVLKALEKGYILIKIYEIWKYQVEQYDPSTRTGGLFTEYISKFLKIKQQASGWPSDCKTEADKTKYINEYFEKEGVALNADEIGFNPGLRQLGKAVITSFWGKLGQRENQPNTSIIKEPSEFFKMLSDPCIIINTITPVNENVVLVNWEYREESYDSLSTVNVCLAAYTTAQARLKLYSYLELLGDKVLYYDTDSVIYISRPGEYDVPLGSFLGEMTDELEEYGKGSYIIEFVSGGPKNYAYQVYSPMKTEYYTTCKTKGISLTYKTSKLINLDSMKGIILKSRENIPIMLKYIRRTTDFNIVTKEQIKQYRATSCKRCFLRDHTSTPYGFKKSKND